MNESRVFALKILAILQKYSDEDHVLSNQQIQDLLLANYDIKMDRKTLNTYLNIINDEGIADISMYQDNRKGYYLISRLFEKSEVQLLCQSIYSSHFLSASLSDKLISKLLSTQSKYVEKTFNETMAQKNKAWKSENKQFFHTIDILLEAIEKKCAVTFNYAHYDIRKQLIFNKEQRYKIHPYYLVQSNNNLYLLCRTKNYQDINAYRIDKILNIELTDEKARPLEYGFDLHKHVKQRMYMYADKLVMITLRFHSMILDDIIDMFGKEIIIQPDREQEDLLITRVCSSKKGMLYFALQYLNNCEILEPQELRDELIECLHQGIDKYQKQ